MYSNVTALTAPLIFLLVCILLHVLLRRVCVPMTFNMEDLFIHNPLDQYILKKIIIQFAVIKSDSSLKWKTIHSTEKHRFYITGNTPSY